MHATSMDEVAGRLDDILAWAKSQRSRLGYYPALYRKMTLSVRSGIEDGFFDDNPRMARIGVAFANRYFEALDRYRNGQQPSHSWQISFDAAQQWWALVTQHLLAGMNAHINLDLGIAVARIVPDGELPGARDDFNRINQLLANLVDEVQSELAEIWTTYRLLDYATGGKDEIIINFSLTKARDAAWSVAERLAPLPAPAQQSEIRRLDQVVFALGRLILYPGILTSAALRLIRLGERKAVPEIIEILS